MTKYQIEVDNKMDDQLRKESKFRKISVEELLTQIVNRYFVPMHTIDQDEMAKGYQETADINLEIANL